MFRAENAPGPLQEMETIDHLRAVLWCAMRSNIQKIQDKRKQILSLIGAKLSSANFFQTKLYEQNLPDYTPFVLLFAIDKMQVRSILRLN